MTWKSRRFRLTLAARWGGNDFLLGHTGWRRVFATSFGWQKANSDSAKVRKWFVEPFPAGIFPLVCIFTWTKQTGVMTFFFDTLRHWLWDSFLFLFAQIRAGKWFCTHGFGAEACQEQGECMSWTCCHTNTEFSFVFAQMKYLVCYLSSNLAHRVSVSHIKARPGILWSLPDLCSPALFFSALYSGKSLLA